MLPISRLVSLYSLYPSLHYENGTIQEKKLCCIFTKKQVFEINFYVNSWGPILNIKAGATHISQILFSCFSFESKQGKYVKFMKRTFSQCWVFRVFSVSLRPASWRILGNGGVQYSRYASTTSHSSYVWYQSLVHTYQTHIRRTRVIIDILMSTTKSWEHKIFS